MLIHDYGIQDLGRPLEEARFVQFNLEIFVWIGTGRYICTHTIKQDENKEPHFFEIEFHVRRIILLHKQASGVRSTSDLELTYALDGDIE